MKRFVLLLFMAEALCHAASAQVPLTGEGTETSPYAISTADDWNNLAKYITDNNDTFEGKCLKVTSDIDFTGVTLQPLWANNVTQMQGFLDGDGHTLKGISIAPAGTYMGLIGTVGANGTIANLTVAGKCEATSVTTGGLTGRVYGTIHNCVNAMDVSSNKPAVGGITGRAFKGAKIIDCINKGTISGTTNIGGIAGTSEAGILFERCGNEGSITLTGNNAGGIAGSPNPSTFTDCWNKADITITGASIYVAGIIGNAMGVAGTDVYNITGCRNSGNITGQRYVAGIVAMIAAANAEVHMTDCHNTGDITSTGTTGNYGASGIAGSFAPLSTFTDCTNSGKITADKAGYNAGIAGGATGAYSAQKPASFTRCSNTGDITSNATCTAGITGYTNGYTTVTDCTNSGNIVCSSLSGGVIGNFDGLNNTMTGCWNTGNVTTNLNRVGGLFGSNTKNGVKVQSCWNAGDVISTSTTTGMADASGAFAIGGLGGIAAAKFYDCFNTGNVKGMTQVGGLVGRPSRNMTGFFRCFSTAYVNGPADQTGNLVGINTSDTQQWSTANKTEGSYYTTDAGACTLDKSIGTETTIAQLCKTSMGENWTSTGDYMLPVPTQFASTDAALLYTAMVVPAENEKLSALTSAFHVGNPNGITWSCDRPEVKISGNLADIVSDYSGEATMTAKLGNYTKSVKIGLDVTTAIDSPVAEKEVATEIWLDATGKRINTSDACTGMIYIILRTYTDGTTDAVKVRK